MPKTTKAAHVHWVEALAGAPSNPAQKKPPSRRTILRSEARELIDGKFGLAVGNPFAGLWYTIEDYAETIVICYGYKIEGWPPSIPFRNMSNVGGCEVLSELIELWKEDKIKFVPATNLDKLNAALDPTLVAPGKGFIHRKNSGGRDDIGRSRYRPKTKPDGGPLRRPKDGPKSAKVIHSDDEDDSQANVRPLRLIPLPLLPPFAPGQFSPSSSSGASREAEESEIEDFLDDEQ
ncbi:uncharacterized protein TRAVEDRAFT_42338 [Trametes versicolor FP-101664 SS1]|uniref:uncharacterized protein n=1 Tax=Trametes versicolor (strain FP-101664) TaxID=717944 RepID=UPI0004623349|nr:uncharacterized protein TRAVEDRAFT_42338 [Trametes versicolor FP-101664 SS1]EIW64928.1 hypothetical protein TRAVEDRAFT_42338 [Trametes versicolor FP-101664 SS1]